MVYRDLERGLACGESSQLDLWTHAVGGCVSGFVSRCCCCCGCCGCGCCTNPIWPLGMSGCHAKQSASVLFSVSVSGWTACCRLLHAHPRGTSRRLHLENTTRRLRAVTTLVRCVWNQSVISNHAWLRFTYISDARMADYIHTHPYAAAPTPGLADDLTLCASEC